MVLGAIGICVVSVVDVIVLVVVVCVAAAVAIVVAADIIVVVAVTVAVALTVCVVVCFCVCACVSGMPAYSVNIHSVGGSVVDKNNLLDLPVSSVFTSGNQLATAEKLSPYDSSRCA